MLKLRSDCNLISQFNSNIQKQRGDSNLTCFLHIIYILQTLTFCFLPSEVKPA